MEYKLHNNKILQLFETPDINEYYYNPYCGIKQYLLTPYCEHIHNQAILFFAICEKFHLEYVVFAGSSIGMIRNKNAMPWMDDYDIIVLDKHKSLFFDTILPVLQTYGFTFWGCGTETRREESGTTFVSGSRYIHNVAFRLDIFWSTIDKRNKIVNLSGKGLYHAKCLDASIFFPPKYYVFNGINLPFCNDIEKEVLLSYGDIHTECIIYSHIPKLSRLVKYNNWKFALSDYDYLKSRAIQNTKDKCNIQTYYPSNKKLLIDSMDVLDMEYGEFIGNSDVLLEFIVRNGIDTINCINFRKYKDVALLVLFYFPNIKINLFIHDLQDITFVDLNYATCIYTYNSEIKTILDDVIYINKPLINVVRVITFGTFDLFHIGHKNIIDNCKRIGKEVIIGVSTDTLNLTKGKVSHKPLTERIRNTQEYSQVDIIFEEESLEQKLDYVKQYDCNVLIMGDDWENKFNSDEYECIYFKRTPGISSTMLRNELN